MYSFIYSYSLFLYANSPLPRYALSLHDALPISAAARSGCCGCAPAGGSGTASSRSQQRSEEHTSELQSPCNLVCRLLLEKKNTEPPKKTCESKNTAPMTTCSATI